MAVWHNGNTLASINKVALRLARLVVGWVTTFGQINHLANQPPRPTQLGHPSVGMRREYWQWLRPPLGKKTESSA